MDHELQHAFGRGRSRTTRPDADRRGRPSGRKAPQPKGWQGGGERLRDRGPPRCAGEGVGRRAGACWPARRKFDRVLHPARRRRPRSAAAAPRGRSTSARSARCKRREVERATSAARSGSGDNRRGPDRGTNRNHSRSGAGEPAGRRAGRGASGNGRQRRGVDALRAGAGAEPARACPRAAPAYCVASPQRVGPGGRGVVRPRH